METANEGRFSSQICSERVDGVNLTTHSPKSSEPYITNPIITSTCPKGTSLAHLVTGSNKKSNQTKLALASTLFVSA